MKKLEKMRDGEEVLGFLTEMHLALRKRSMEAADNYIRARHDAQTACQIGDREPTVEEKRNVHNLAYEAERLHNLLWKTLNDDFQAWENNLGVKMDAEGRTVLVRCEDNPLDQIMRVLRPGGFHG